MLFRSYALIYTLEEIHTDENGEDLEQSYYMVSYRADYPGRTPRRRFYSYWTSVKGNQNELNENAYILHGKGGKHFGSLKKPFRRFMERTGV